MAKPKAVPGIEITSEQAAKEPVFYKAKVFQMVVGCDLIGSKMSMAASKAVDIDVTALGAIARSKNSNRTILIPWTNIKGLEIAE